MSLDKPTTRKTLRIEETLEEDSNVAIQHYDLDDFHAYVRFLIRRDIKTLHDRGILNSEYYS